MTPFEFGYSVKQALGPAGPQSAGILASPLAQPKQPRQSAGILASPLAQPKQPRQSAGILSSPRPQPQQPQQSAGILASPLAQPKQPKQPQQPPSMLSRPFATGVTAPPPAPAARPGMKLERSSRDGGHTERGLFYDSVPFAHMLSNDTFNNRGNAQAAPTSIPGAMVNDTFENRGQPQIPAVTQRALNNLRNPRRSWEEYFTNLPHLAHSHHARETLLPFAQSMVNDTFDNRGNAQAPAPTLPGVLQTPEVQQRYKNRQAPERTTPRSMLEGGIDPRFVHDNADTSNWFGSQTPPDAGITGR